MLTEERFGFEWNKYSDIEPYKEHYKAQFLNWIHPIKPEFFKGKKILDAGCGMGRNSYWPALWGASSVVAFDKDERSVIAAKKNLKEFSNVLVTYGDIYDLPWQDEFDIVFSIGVIHHLHDASMAVEQLKKAVKPAGTVLIWVYSKEGWEELLKILDPIRINFTSFLPPGLLHLITYFLSIPLYLYLQIFASRKNEYFSQLKRFRFSHVHSIIFDQLLPPIANYYNKPQACGLLDGFKSAQVLRPPNGNGWICIGIK